MEKQIAIRVSGAMHEQIAALADEQGRTIQKQALKLLEMGLNLVWPVKEIARLGGKKGGEGKS